MQDFLQRKDIFSFCSAAKVVSMALKDILQKGRTCALKELKGRLSLATGNTHSLLIQNIQQANLEISRPTTGDGNCMFHALLHQMEQNGEKQNCTAQELRLRIIEDLRSYPLKRIGFGGQVNTVDFRAMHGDNWEEYLDKMSEPTEYGDHLMLQAAAHYLRRHILVVTSSPQGGLDNNLIILTPSPNDPSEPVILLGHHHENHYESLKPRDDIGVAFKASEHIRAQETRECTKTTQTKSHPSTSTRSYQLKRPYVQGGYLQVVPPKVLRQSTRIDLELTIDLQELHLQSPWGLLGLTDECIVGCKGSAVRFDHTGHKVGDYMAETMNSCVCSVCRFDESLFLIQQRSVTVYNINDFNSTGFNLRSGSRGLCHQVPGAEGLVAGVATGLNNLILVDPERNRVVEWKVGARKTKTVLADLSQPYSICTQRKDGYIYYFVTLCQANCVNVYDKNWKLHHVIGGVNTSQLSSPWDAVVTWKGTVIISDTDNYRLCEFGQDGSFIKCLVSKEQLGLQPCNISLSPPFLWVRTWGDKILKFKFYSF